MASAFIEILNRTSPGAVRLARLASLASRVEPELLRALRLQHLPDVDSGAEADLWFSPIVKAASPLGLVFRTEVLDQFRQDLTKDEYKSLVDDIRETIKFVHQNAPPTIQLEEEVTYLSLKGISPEKVNEALMPAVATLVESKNKGMARWARRVLTRLPENARETRAAKILDAQSAAHLGKEILLGNPSSGAIRWIEWLAPENIEKTSISVRLLDLEGKFKWELSHPPVPDAYTLEVPKTDPIILEVEWQTDFSDAKQILLPLNNFVTLPYTNKEIKLRTGIGKTYIFQVPLQKNESNQDITNEVEFLEVGGSPLPGATLHQLFRGHISRINHIVWSPNGHYIASGSEDKTIRIWDVKQGQCIAVLDEHKSGVTSLDWSPDGEYLASGSSDGSLILWNAKSWNTIRVTQAHLNTISCVSWSPSGDYIASSSYDGTVHIRDRQTFKMMYMLSDHEDWVRGLAWSPDGKRIASCGDDQLIYVYSTDNYSQQQVLLGHKDWVRCVSWSPDGLYILTGSDDFSIRTWDSVTGQLLDNFQSHIDVVLDVAFSPDGRLLVSKSADGTVKIWQKETTWSSIASLTENTTGAIDNNFTFHPDGSKIATLGSDDQIIRVWELDFRILLNQYSERTNVNYVTAKIVLVGDSGVGKTGLGWRLAHNVFKEHASTHGQQFWKISELGLKRKDGAECEAVLWDLAGQHAYRQIHSIFLENVDAALVLFDPNNRQDPLKGAQFWLEQLKGKGQLPPTVLVGARVDRGSPAFSQQELDLFCQRYAIKGGYISTSAKSGEGLHALLETLKALIPWEEMTATVTTVTFKHIKDYVLSLKEKTDRKGVLVSPKELRALLESETSEVLKTLEVWTFTDAEMMTAVGHLETHGYVSVLRNSAGEQYILLTPELLVNIAASIMLLADKNSRELGAVSETDLLQGKISFEELKGLDNHEGQILLDVTILLFLEHSICFRETLGSDTLLIFPSLIKQKRPLQDDAPITDDISYVVRGRVENLFASLVTLLGYTPSFMRINQWQNQAQYEMGAGEICGFRIIEEREGEIELVLYYDDKMPLYGRKMFQELFEQFLYQRDVEVTRFPPVICKNRHQQKRAIVINRVREGKNFMFCDECGEKILLPDFDKPQTIGIGASAWLQVEEATARLRSSYEVHLTRVKSYRRAWATPRCYVSHLPEQSDWAKKLIHDLQDAGIYIIDQAIQVKAEDFLILLDTPAYRKAFQSSSASLGTENQLVKSRLKDSNNKVIALTYEGSASKHDLKTCKPGDFNDETHYSVSLFNLVLSLYAIPLNHAGFAPLRQKLHEQWEQTLAGKKRKDLSALKIFVSYSHKDEAFKEELVRMLAGLQRRGIVDAWHDRRIEAGDEWYKSIQDAMDDCDIAILLVSPDYLASRFIQEDEQPKLLKRREEMKARVMPIIIRPCIWQNEETISILQVMPKDGRAVITFSKENGDRDQAWADIASVIEKRAKAKSTP